jgi:hypothetical protein
MKNIFEEYMGHHPGGIKAAHYLSIIYENLGDQAKAHEYLEKYSFLESLRKTQERKETSHEYKTGNQWCRKAV